MAKSTAYYVLCELGLKHLKTVEYNGFAFCWMSKGFSKPVSASAWVHYELRMGTIEIVPSL